MDGPQETDPEEGERPHWWCYPTLRESVRTRRTCLSEVRDEGGLRVRTVPSLDASQGEGHSSSGEVVQGRVPHSVHSCGKDHEEAGN